MTVFEKIKAMNIDEFAEWFDKHCSHDDDPCIKWWNDNYCSNCEPEISDYGFEYCWCERHDNKCRYFPDMQQVPDTLQMTKLWLESEA